MLPDRSVLLVRRALALAGASALLVGVGPAHAATLRSEVLAEQRQAGNGRAALENLVAGYGYVGWLERSARGGRVRIVLGHGGATRRSAWMSGNVSFGLARRVDGVSGRAVVRVQLVRKPAAGTATTRLLLPSTLRPSNARWTELPVPVLRQTDSAGEDAQIVSVTTEPEVDVAPERLMGGRAAPTQCPVTLAPGPAVIPVLPDCSEPQISFRGGLVALWAQVPSESGDGSERGQSFLTALSLFRLASPERGWRRVASNVGAYEGDAGLQRFCLADGGAVILEGSNPEFDTSDPSTWTLRYAAADPAAMSWSAPAPGLRYGDLACDGRKIYALASKTVGHGSRQKVTTRVMRLTPRL